MAANSIAPPPNDADDETKRLQADSDAVGAAQDSEIFANYAPTHANPGPPHPGDVAEAASLAATAAPRTTYEVIEVLRTGGTLSNLQLECVQLASQRHLTVLPMQPPTRCGFFLGDGAGVGKGRQLAGIILDNLARGRSKHLWFSSSADLKHDAVRDLSDLGCHLPVHDGCQGLDRGSKGLGLSTEMTRGVLFSTYATLVSATSAQKQSGKSRLRQLVEWCGGPDFEGCLMLDECHKAKNFQPGKEEASSKVAQAVIELQRALPMARVVYCSATGASDLSNMAYMERLGLWGPFSAFATFEAFTEGVKNRGVGGLEMLAMEMKASSPLRPTDGL